MNAPAFVSRATVEMIHHGSLEQHGGQDGIRDETALESALAQPLHVFHYAQGDLFAIAAAYAYHLAENQPFIDGNKRTAIATALLFLEGNGVRSLSLTDDQLYDAMIGIAEKRIGSAWPRSSDLFCPRETPRPKKARRVQHEVMWANTRNI